MSGTLADAFDNIFNGDGDGDGDGSGPLAAIAATPIERLLGASE